MPAVVLHRCPQNAGIVRQVRLRQRCHHAASAWLDDLKRTREPRSRVCPTQSFSTKACGSPPRPPRCSAGIDAPRNVLADTARADVRALPSSGDGSARDRRRCRPASLHPLRCRGDRVLRCPASIPPGPAFRHRRFEDDLAAEDRLQHGREVRLIAAGERAVGQGDPHRSGLRRRGEVLRSSRPGRRTGSAIFAGSALPTLPSAVSTRA